MKNAHDEQVDRYLTESRQTKNNSGVLWAAWAVTVIVGGVILLVAIASVLGSAFSGTSSRSSSNDVVGIFFAVLAGILGYVLPVLAIVSKAKSNRLKRKAVERYNDIVKSGK